MWAHCRPSSRRCPSRRWRARASRRWWRASWTSCSCRSWSTTSWPKWWATRSVRSVRNAASVPTNTPSPSCCSGPSWPPEHRRTPPETPPMAAHHWRPLHLQQSGVCSCAGDFYSLYNSSLMCWWWLTGRRVIVWTVFRARPCARMWCTIKSTGSTCGKSCPTARSTGRIRSAATRSWSATTFTGSCTSRATASTPTCASCLIWTRTLWWTTCVLASRRDIFTLTSAQSWSPSTRSSSTRSTIQSMWNSTRIEGLENCLRTYLPSPTPPTTPCSPIGRRSALSSAVCGQCRTFFLFRSSSSSSSSCLPEFATWRLMIILSLSGAHVYYWHLVSKY